MISAKTNVGLAIVEYLNRNKKAKACEIIEYLDCSKPWFERCMKPLTESGIVISHRGCYGFYELSGNKVTFWDLIKAYNEEKWSMVGDSWDVILGEFAEVAKKHNVIGGE